MMWAMWSTEERGRNGGMGGGGEGKGKKKTDANKEEKVEKRQTRKCKFNGKRGTDKKVTCKKM